MSDAFESAVQAGRNSKLISVVLCAMEDAVSPRWRGEYLATLVPGNGEPRYCLDSDMSDGGMRINAVGLRVPDEFGLRLSGHGYTKSYRVIWRNGHDVGAKLISPSPSAQADPSEIRAK
jgi:hypothetical protein